MAAQRSTKTPLGRSFYGVGFVYFDVDALMLGVILVFLLQAFDKWTGLSIPSRCHTETKKSLVRLPWKLSSWAIMPVSLVFIPWVFIYRFLSVKLPLTEQDLTRYRQLDWQVLAIVPLLRQASSQTSSIKPPALERKTMVGTRRFS